ncbi:hypothetical protein ACLOJK_002183 [Asimina triloba]
MKSSLRKLRGLGLHRHDVKEKKDHHRLAQLDELEQANQDMLDMRNCYDSLLSAAAATTNSAYEFSESLREMGACLLERTAQNEDEESDIPEISSVASPIRCEIENQLNLEGTAVLFVVTDVANLHLIFTVRVGFGATLRVAAFATRGHELESGEITSLLSKGYMDTPPLPLQTAQEEYDEEATLFVFRLKSLKQGQSRSLLTQAARHHAAQLNFFEKGLKSLEAVEPHVKLVTEQQHIDYQFIGLEDEDAEDGDDDYGDDTNDDGELSFDYGHNDHGQDAISTSRNSMEVDQVDLSSAAVSAMGTAKENIDKIQGDFSRFHREVRVSSQSAPIFLDKKSDAAERMREMRPASTRKFHTYVLPTPDDTVPAISISSIPGAKQMSRQPKDLWHSSPLVPKKHLKDLEDRAPSDPADQNSKAQSVLKESNSTSIRTPLAEGFSFRQFDPRSASDLKKIKRYAFSGPITSQGWSNASVLYGSGPISSGDHPHLVSSGLSRAPLRHPSISPRISPPTSPPLMASPKISELHELPRPPVSLGLVGHSAPLVSQTQELSPTNKATSMAPKAASPLPIPPGSVIRSYSIPSSGQRVATLSSSTNEEVASPPLTPISLTNSQPASTASESVTRTGKI